MSNHKNAHPTDKYVYWGDKNGAETSKKLKEIWAKLEQAGLLQDALFLVETACNTQSLEDAYNNEDFNG